MYLFLFGLPAAILLGGVYCMYKRSRTTREPEDEYLEGYYVYPGPVVQQPNPQMLNQQLYNPPYWSAPAPHGTSQATWQHPPQPNPLPNPEFDEKARDTSHLTRLPSVVSPSASPITIADTMLRANGPSKMPSEKVLVRDNSALILPVGPERSTSFPSETENLRGDLIATPPPDALAIPNEALIRKIATYDNSVSLNNQLEAELQSENLCNEPEVLPRYTSGDAMGFKVPYQRISLKQDGCFIGRKNANYTPPQTIGRLGKFTKNDDGNLKTGKRTE